MKAIIIAAGKGSRLSEQTKDTPKCMLHVGGKPIIEHQMEIFSHHGIKDIAVIKGYMGHKINYPQLFEFHNKNYEKNNILGSLMKAEEFLDDDVIVSYSDIIYSSNVVAALLQAEEQISAVVDVDWRQKYIGRDSHPESEAEKVRLNGRHEAIEFGKVVEGCEEEIGEFIGLFKLSKEGAFIFKQAFNSAYSNFRDKPFMRAAKFEQAYVTDMLSYLISMGEKVHCTVISEEWREIDTEQDLTAARQWIEAMELL
ncbi:MAG: phosphocholine cytidylyltransferase family protein [Gammaproteobacteria bacterium]